MKLFPHRMRLAGFAGLLFFSRAACCAETVESMNVARGFSGAGAFIWDERTGHFVALPALGAVIDDDVTSGWTPASGKTRLLIQLQQPAEIAEFSLYAPGAEGAYSVQIAEDADALASGRITRVAANAELGSLNKTPLPAAKARYVLVDLDVVKTAPLRGMQVMGAPQAGTTANVAVVSPKAGGDDKGNKGQGETAEVNFALKAAGAATLANPAEDNKLIDGDTATTTRLPANKKDAIIRLASSVEIDRIALAVGRAEGTITIFVTDAEGHDLRELGRTTLDGRQEAISLDTAGVRAEFVRIEWTPAAGAGDLVVKEVGIFAQAVVTRSEPPPNVAAVTLPIQVSAPAAVAPPATTPPPEPVPVRAASL